MLTTTCTLTVGTRRLTASVSTASPQQQAEVTYSGDVELLPKTFSPLANADLRQLCKAAATLSGAKLKIKDDGAFERFAA